jgi:hypothetical protein
MRAEGGAAIGASMRANIRAPIGAGARAGEWGRARGGQKETAPGDEPGAGVRAWGGAGLVGGRPHALIVVAGVLALSDFVTERAVPNQNRRVAAAHGFGFLRV